MRRRIETDLTRRTLLQLGLLGAAGAMLPWTRAREAWAAGATAPHFLVTFFGDGGWDVTQVFDVHDPADATDGVDVDVPQAVSGLPPSRIATAGGVTYISNSTSRPAADTFFGRWGSRSAVINGINTRSTSHDQSRQLVLTGYLDPTRADFAVMSARQNGADLPLPHLLLSGPSYAGPFAGLSGRVGGQLSQVLGYNKIPDANNPDNTVRAVSAAGETAIQQALETQRTIDQFGALTGRIGQFHDANVRGDQLASLANSLPRDSGDGTQLANSVGAAFRAGMTASVTVNNVGGFDTHSNNQNQSNSWQDLFTFLDQFLSGLAAQAGVASPTLLDETTVVYCSEFGRTPELNGDNGKDHHPWTSVLVVGKGVHGGMTFGLTDRDQVGVKVNFATGRPDDTGQIIDVTNLVAGVMTLVGANSNDYLAGVRPFTAMVA